MKHGGDIYIAGLLENSTWDAEDDIETAGGVNILSRKQKEAKATGKGKLRKGKIENILRMNMIFLTPRRYG